MAIFGYCTEIANKKLYFLGFRPLNGCPMGPPVFRFDVVYLSEIARWSFDFSISTCEVVDRMDISFFASMMTHMPFALTLEVELVSILLSGLAACQLLRLRLGPGEVLFPCGCLTLERSSLLLRLRLDPGEVVFVRLDLTVEGSAYLVLNLVVGTTSTPCHLCLCVLGCGHWSLVVDHGLMPGVSLVVD